MPDPVVRKAGPGDAEPIGRLWRDAVEAGELEGFVASELPLLLDRLAVAPDGVLVAEAAGGTTGFLHPNAHVLVVDRPARRRGCGRALVAEAERRLAAEGEQLLLWLPGANPAARAFYAAVGYAYHSSMWQMRLDEIGPTPLPDLPGGLEIVSVDRVPIEDYVELANASFAGHPTPFHVTTELVRWAHARPEFEPSQIGVLRVAAVGELIGYCRTRPGGDGEPGEIALIGVMPAWRGQGLGRALLTWGLHRLAQAGRTRAELSVEARNDGALGMYRQAGFQRVFEWPRYARASAP